MSLIFTFLPGKSGIIEKTQILICNSDYRGGVSVRSPHNDHNSKGILPAASRVYHFPHGAHYLRNDTFMIDITAPEAPRSESWAPQDTMWLSAGLLKWDGSWSDGGWTLGRSRLWLRLLQDPSEQQQQHKTSRVLSFCAESNERVLPREGSHTSLNIQANFIHEQEVSMQ